MKPWVQTPVLPLIIIIITVKANVMYRNVGRTVQAEAKSALCKRKNM
jgi:hypothetical protein